jgi:flagellar motor protein MotB
MKSYLLLPLAVFAFLSLTLLGGCTREAELEAANRRMGEQLENANQKLGEVQKALSERERQLAAANQTIQNKDKEIAFLNEQVALLKKQAEDLSAQLAAARGQKLQPVTIVRGNALPPGFTKALKDLIARHPEFKLKFYPELGMVKFENDDTFQPGKDDVKPEMQKVMGELATILNEPDALVFDIYLAGHTDDMPIKKGETKARHPNNRYLSVHRAVAIDAIFEKAGVNGGRIGTVGFDEFHPIAPNKPGNKGNAANRRVELWIVGPDRFVVPPAGSVSEPTTDTPEPTVPPTTTPPVDKPAE